MGPGPLRLPRREGQPLRFKRTVESYSRMLWRFFEHTTPDRITPADVLGYAPGIGLSGKPPSPVTIGARIACLSQVPPRGDGDLARPWRDGSRRCPLVEPRPAAEGELRFGVHGKKDRQVITAPITPLVSPELWQQAQDLDGLDRDAYDNAMAESFFASLETELIDRSSFRTRADARLAVFDYIEAFYDPHRRHSALGYLSPAEFERGYRPEETTAA